jgi:hypothetical protein
MTKLTKTHQLACTGQLTYAQNNNTFVLYDGGLGFQS